MISIIIPTRNEERKIVTTLRCLQEIRKKKICEIICIDGSSIDKTIEKAQNLTDIILKHQPCRSLQLNIGASVASGEILLFLHADTTISPEEIINLNNGINKIKWGFYKIKFDSKKIQFKILAFFINLRSKVFKYATGDQAIFVENKLFNSIGGFSNLKLMEDVNICSKLLKIHRPFFNKFHVITSSRRWDDYGFISTIFKMRLLRLMYYLGVKTQYLEKQYK